MMLVKLMLVCSKLQIRYSGGGVSAKAHFNCSYRILRGKNVYNQTSFCCRVICRLTFVVATCLFNFLLEMTLSNCRFECLLVLVKVPMNLLFMVWERS